MPPRTGRVHALAIIAAVVLLASAGVRISGEAASIMMWPLNPVLRSDERASALWIENRGRDPVTLQIRVLRWEVDDYKSRYVEQQDDVVGSPPVATIAPGQRQLVRLMKIRQPAAGTEAAYRVLIDELPNPTDADGRATGQTSLGVTFRMRYSLPLFAYGSGLSPLDRNAPDRAVQSGPSLSWHITTEDGARWLHIRNTGTHHARLTDVRLATDSAAFDVARGLLGYALPGHDMRWPVPPDVPDLPLSLEARINGASAASLPRR